MPDGFNWIGIISWLCGYAVIKLIPYGVPFAQGIIIAAALYVILAKMIKDVYKRQGITAGTQIEPFRCVEDVGHADCRHEGCGNCRHEAGIFADIPAQINCACPENDHR